MKRAMTVLVSSLAIYVLLRGVLQSSLAGRGNGHDIIAAIGTSAFYIAMLIPGIAAGVLASTKWLSLGSLAGFSVEVLWHVLRLIDAVSKTWPGSALNNSLGSALTGILIVSIPAIVFGAAGGALGCQFRSYMVTESART